VCRHPVTRVSLPSLGVSEQHLEIRMEAFVMKRKTPGLPDPRNEVN
jgi:hypothetical protein